MPSQMNMKLITLVHVTTVPLSLRFVAGQAAYMRARDLKAMLFHHQGSH